MSGGSLKDLVRSLNAALSVPIPLYPIHNDIHNAIQAYLNKHVMADEHESQRLHEELLGLYATKVQGHPDKLAFFLGSFRQLRHAIYAVDHLLKWWEVLVRPTLDSMGQAKAVVADSRSIVLSVLAYDEDEDPTGQKARASSVFIDKLFEIFLERTRLTSTSEKIGGIRDEQKHRFVSSNVETVLLAYGKQRPKAFLEKVDEFMVQRDSRLQILGLLCSYVRLQGPHLYQVLQTSLLDNLLRCLENDTSTTVISLALTVLVMFMPHLCNSLGSYLPRLFIVFTRVLCWDKFGIVRLEDKFTNLDAYSRTSTPLSSEIHEDTVGDSAWQTLHSSFEYASSTTPDVSDYFSFLYGLYPINFLSFIREPYKFLDRVAYKDIDQLDIEEETIRQRTEFYRQRHILHPNFLTLTAETELTDQSRWMKVEPADVTAQCIGLVNKNVLAEDVKKSMRIERFDSIPESLIPTEEIPIESLLSQRDDYSPNDDITEHDHYFALPSPDNDNIDGNPQLNPGQSVSTARIGPFSRHLKSLGSPTNLGYSQSEDSRLWDMLKLQEQLHNSMSKPDDGISSLHGMLSHSTGTPVYPGSLAASPRLDAYVHSLSQNTVPRSPALRPAASDAQETIAYLQREVMLLKNDLNFERYLKQQHSSHIGHLQRKHIKESTAEAETQNLINTNKNLKAKLEEAKKAYTAARQEAKQSKSQAKKWEVELSTKIRTLREEQKAWRQDEEVTKKALEAAREEAENLRKLLAESEAEGLRSNQKLQIMKAEMEEVDKLRSFVDHLSSKLVDYERRSDEFEAQRHREEGAIAQVECMKLRLVSCEKELLKLQEGYENRFLKMLPELKSCPAPVISYPGPGFQRMIDNAMDVADSRFKSLKKAYDHLLCKHGELEMKYVQLKAGHEMDEVVSGRSVAQSHSQIQSILSMSDNESNDLHDGRNFPQRRQRYQPSEDSMSPHSSYTGSSTENHSSSQNFNMPNNPQSPITTPSGHPIKCCSGYMSSDIIQPLHHDYFSQYQGKPMLRHQSFIADSVERSIATLSKFSSSTNDIPEDGQSMRTITSTDSPEQYIKERIKSQSDLRVRGKRIQNTSKKSKNKGASDGDIKEPKLKKKSRFPTGSGLAGIRGFV